MPIVQFTRTFDVNIPKGATHYYGTIKDEEADGVIWYKVRTVTDCAAGEFVWSKWCDKRKEWMFLGYDVMPSYIHEIKY